MDPVRTGWRISDLVAYDTAVADSVARIAGLTAHAEPAPTGDTVDAVRAELRACADGATP